MGLYDLQLPDVSGSSLFVDIANDAPVPQLNTYATLSLIHISQGIVR